MNSTRVALPKTYHQLAVLLGTGCVAEGRMSSFQRRRSSSQSATDCRRPRVIARLCAGPARVSHGLREGRDLSAADPELSVLDLVLVLVEAARRRPRRALAVLVVDAAVARAHEEAGLREPPHRAAEVGAVDREHLELPIVDAAHPARRVCRHSVPRDGEGVLVGREPGLLDGEVVEAAERDPGLPRALAR